MFLTQCVKNKVKEYKALLKALFSTGSFNIIKLLRKKMVLKLNWNMKDDYKKSSFTKSRKKFDYS